MTEEFITDRERDLLDYIRNSISDPETRGTDAIDTFTATAGQTVFILNNVLVKNVAETIVVNSVTKRKGYDYTVSYGEGKEQTTVTLNVGASAGNIVIIGYHYGDSMIEREFSRTDVKLPRVVLMFLTGSEEIGGIGDALEYGTGNLFNASYRIEIRDRYATRAKRLTSQLFNLGLKMRHSNLYRTLFSISSDMQNFDYDIEKNAYVWQFTLNVQWELKIQ